MKHKSIMILAVIVVCMAIYFYFAITIENGPEFGVSIDLARPIAIIWPCEVSIVGDEGQKGLRIAPKIGRGWKGEAGGEASYKFFAPSDGKYHVWAYCLWYDECANAVFAKFDDTEKAIIGNDPVCGKWHWVRGFDVELKKGTHRLTLSNHSDHIAVQKIVLRNSASANPQEAGIVFSDIFYDGFDGCDRGNFAQWHQIGGTWTVRNPDSDTCITETSLVGKSNGTAFIIYPEKWQDYCLNVSVKSMLAKIQGQAIGVCFGVTDPNTYYQLEIKPLASGTSAKMAIIKKDKQQERTLGQFDGNFDQSQWRQIQIELHSGYLTVKVAQNEPITIRTDEKIIGGIGFLLKGEMTACFDDIHVRTIDTVTGFETRNSK